MADWTAALLNAAGATTAKLVGHSMGSLIALETAARHPTKVSALSLIGTAATMTVGPDLLKAAEANDHAAIDMVSIWGLGYQAELGGSLAPGLWMHSGAQRVLENGRPGVLFNDLSACNAYQGALDARESRQGARRRAAEFAHGNAARRRSHDDGRAARRTAASVAGLIARRRFKA
jgi:pimeloyl-ACP methyl ester carboxylesterase